MNRAAKLQFLKDLSEGKTSMEALNIDNSQLLIIEDPYKPLLNDKTVLSPELIKTLKQHFRDWGGYLHPIPIGRDVDVPVPVDITHIHTFV